MSYSDFQNQPSSEKITLATLEAGKRLMGWTLDSGSIYKLTGFDYAKISSLEDSGNAYTEVSSLGAVTASTFFNDRVNKILYLRTTGSDNPNGRFLAATVKLFFANVPIALPHDLDSGFEVFFEPMIQSTSQFGVEIDTINQASEAIEGSGTLTLQNDHDFWPSNFDKLYFENKLCMVYSYNRMLEANEAKLIYRGRVEKKGYTSTQVSFSLKDTLSELRSPIDLGTIADLGLRTSTDLDKARQRLVLGRVFGHRPVNTDQVLDGYPITGTVSVAYNSATLTGSGTDFLTQLSPDDRIILGGTEYTVATVTSSTSATITENFSDVAGLAGAMAYLIPDQPKRWINRTWNLAGHVLREPVTAVANGSSITRLMVDSTEDIYADDWIYIGPIGSGELIQVSSVVGERVLNLRTSLATIPPIGTVVTRPSVQNVRLDDISLVYYQDYTFDASTATLTLRNTAEANSAPIRNLTSTLGFTNTSRTVSGSGLKNLLKPGYMVGVQGNAVFFEVLSVDSDTQATLRTPATFTATTGGRYIPYIFDPENSVLSLDVLGKTEDGTTNGRLLKTAPSIVKALITDAGLASLIDTASFSEAEDAAPMHLGYVAPKTFDDDTAPIYRDIIDEINKSVFGSLIQTSDFQLAYGVIQPVKSAAALQLQESDILGITFESTAERVVKTSIVEYLQKEYDYLISNSNYSTAQKTSDIANYITEATREQTFNTFLVDQKDASRAAARWAFILENGAGKATLTTKLQAMSVDVGSVIEVTHRKFFERMGLTTKTRLFMVQAVKKTGSDVTLEIVDLSNAFSRVASFNTLTSTYDTATDREKLYGGFITDAYGLISNDPDSFGTNSIW